MWVGLIEVWLGKHGFQGKAQGRCEVARRAERVLPCVVVPHKGLRAFKTDRQAGSWPLCVCGGGLVRDSSRVNACARKVLFTVPAVCLTTVTRAVCVVPQYCVGACVDSCRSV